MTTRRAFFAVMPLVFAFLIGGLVTYAQTGGRGPVIGTRPYVSYSEINIARDLEGGKILYATSEFDKDYAAVHLIDGKVDKDKDGAAWASKGWDPNKPEEIVIGFKDTKPRLIGMIVVDPSIPYPSVLGRTVKNVQVFTTDAAQPDIDGIKSGNTRNWKYVARLEVSDQYEPQVFEFSPVEARYIWLHVIENHGSDKYVAIGEVQIYEALTQSDELDALITRMEQLIRDMRRYREQMRVKGDGERGKAAKVEAAPGDSKSSK